MTLLARYRRRQVKLATFEFNFNHDLSQYPIAQRDALRRDYLRALTENADDFWETYDRLKA